MILTLSLLTLFFYIIDIIVPDRWCAIEAGRIATFLKSVVELESRYDAFIKWYDVIREKYVYDDCCLGLYAIRYKYLKEFNYIEMLQHPSMEHVFAKYVREEVPVNRVAEVRHLGLLRENNKQLV